VVFGLYKDSGGLLFERSLYKSVKQVTFIEYGANPLFIPKGQPISRVSTCELVYPNSVYYYGSGGEPLIFAPLKFQTLILSLGRSIQPCSRSPKRVLVRVRDELY
jgi:hypothetical protein